MHHTFGTLALGQEEVIGCLKEKVPHCHAALDFVDFAGRMFPMTRAGTSESYSKSPRSWFPSQLDLRHLFMRFPERDLTSLPLLPILPPFCGCSGSQDSQGLSQCTHTARAVATPLFIQGPCFSIPHILRFWHPSWWVSGLMPARESGKWGVHPSLGRGRKWTGMGMRQQSHYWFHRQQWPPRHILSIVALVKYYKVIEYNIPKYITDLPIIGIGVEV